MAYIEAFETYWNQSTLTVLRNIDDECIGCGLVSVCRYLPAIIKDNLQHLANVKLPIIELAESTPDDPTWTPALLQQFPKLKSLVFNSWVLFGYAPSDMARNARGPTVRVPDADNFAQFYHGVGPFTVVNGVRESPWEYMERMIGVKRSHGVMLLSENLSPEPPGTPPP